MTRFLRPQDIVLVLLFSAMAALDPNHDAWIIGMISVLGVLQILESKIPFAGTTLGKVVWILLKLTIGYALIGYTGGVDSLYYLVLLLPIVSAATALGVYSTLAVSLLACAAYLSFVLFLGPQYKFDLGTQFKFDFIGHRIHICGPGDVCPNDDDLEMAFDQARVLVLRLLFLAVAGNLVSALADVLREQYIRYRKLAEELARTEAAFRRADRLAALGQLSAGLAHELRNPLGTIKASAEMLSRNLPQGNELAAEMSGFISAEVDRTNSLVSRFLDFARPLSLRKEPADVTQTIDRAIQQVARENGAVPIVRDYSADLEPIPIDAEMMERVFYNLLLNAVQASPEGSAVTIRTRQAHPGAEIAVIDHGSGIPKDQTESVFNPFFTTKPNGTGLGLPICAKIVDEHHGKLTVESETGKGSIFRVLIPQSEK
jgi:two-component system, NtrC family, sensor histidine kinase HydH